MYDTDSDQEETTAGSKNLQRIVPPKILSELTHLDLSGRLTAKKGVVDNGAFGDVYVGRCEIPSRGRIKVAIKLLRFCVSEDVKMLFEKEIYVWAKLKHDNVLPLLGYAFDDQTGYPLLVSEWMKNGSAWTYVFSHHECNLMHLIAGIARGLAYLHENDIVHSDIKSDNVLVTDTGDALICDFGCSRMIAASRTMANLSTGIKGTAQYTAYEVLAWPNEYRKHSKETDVWAFGMTTYELLYQQRPYANHIQDQIPLIISSGSLPQIPKSTVKHSIQVSDVLSKICSRCWELDPVLRVDMPTLVQELDGHVLTMESAPQSLKRASEAKQSESKRLKLGNFGQSSEDVRGLNALVLSSNLNSSSTTPERLFNGCDDSSLFTQKGDDWLVSYNSNVERRLGIRAIHTLLHESTICCIRFSPNGKHLATGCNRGARVYNTKSGIIKCFLSHGTNATQDLHVRSLCFSPNGKLLATGSEDKFIRVWDLAKKKVVYILEGHDKDVYSVEFTKDARNIVSGSLDGTIRIWNTQNHSHRILEMDESISSNLTGVTSISISPDGLQIAAAYLDAIVRIWHFNTGKLIRKLLGHSGSINSIFFTPSGEGIISGSSDKSLRYWSINIPSNGIEQDKSLLNFIGHKDAVLSIATTKDGQWVISGSRDHGVQLWEAKTAQAQLHIQGHRSPVTSIDISSQDGIFATGSGDMQARLWSFYSSPNETSSTLSPHNTYSLPTTPILPTPTLPTPTPPTPITYLFLPTTITIGLEDVNPETLPADLKKVGHDWFAIFNPKVKRVLDINLLTMFVHESVVCCVRFSADGKLLATGCNRTAQIFDTKNGQKLCVLQDDTASLIGDLYIRSVCFSPDGKFLATGAEDKAIRVWDIGKKRVKRVFEGHQQEIYSLDFSKNGRLIVSGSGDRTARIWDMETGMQKILEINDPDGVDAGVTSVAISPDMRLVAAGSLDTVVRIWEVQTGNLIERLRGHCDSVYSVAFTPDGKGIVSGSLDKTLKHWDISALVTDPTRKGPLSHATSPTGSDIAAGGGGERGSVNTLNFSGHENYVLSVAVSHDGQWVVSGSKDRRVHFWDQRTAQVQVLLEGHKNSVISVDLSPVGGMFATGGGDMQARLWTYSTI